MCHVSVIIPVFNGEQFLRKCLDSVTTQSLNSIEIIIVNDGSTDESMGIIDEYAQTDTRFKIINNESNRGLPFSRKLGLKQACGEYVVYLDCDDYWSGTNVLEDLYQISSSEGCEILRFNGLRYGGKSKESIFKSLEVVNQSLDSNLSLCKFYNLCCFFFQRRYLKSINLIFYDNVGLGEDAIFLSQALMQSNKISSINNHFYIYRINHTSMTHKNWGIDQFLEEEKSAWIVSDYLKNKPKVHNIYISQRMKHYWPNKIAKRLTSLSQDERFTVYQEARKTFIQLDLNIRNPHVKFHRDDIYLHECFLNENYDELDALTGHTLCISLRLLIIRSRQYIKNISALNYTYNLSKCFVKKIKNKQKKIMYKSTNPDITKYYNNIENIQKFNFSHSGSGKKKGISVMLRVKNEQRNIQRCLESIVDVFDEIVVIDNNSTDKTMEIVINLCKQVKYKTKLKLVNYPYSIARCGRDHSQTPDNSVHSLVYYYNWCLSQCDCSVVCKWDADMILTSNSSERIKFQEFLELVKGYSKPTTVSLVTQTIYNDSTGESFVATNEKYKEIRLFTNSPCVYFIKSDEWEALHTEGKVMVLLYNEGGIYEMKDAREDEFSHWSSISFNGARKSREFRNFQLVKKDIHRQKPDVFIPINL